MSLPIVAIVGRPNVGKSSLFNSIARRRTAIVDPTAGVTRDRITTICDLGESYFELVDTGGHGIVDRDDLGEHVERQIRYAIDLAKLILFVVDAREGLTPLDTSTAELLRAHHGRVKLVANKVDEPHLGDGIGEFCKLGFGDPLAVSAANGSGRPALMELIEFAIAGTSDEVPDKPVMNIAIVGKRNAGKSSFINTLAGEERVIVSETPGTTRDSIDVRFEKDDRTLVAIDTAGVRKKNKMADDVEFYAYSRATQSIRRCDVALLLIDATVPVGQVDKRLAKLVASEFKPCVLVVNKWDLAKGRASSEDYGEYLSKVLPEVDYAPVAFTSAITGRNIDSTIDVATELFKQTLKRVGTGQLNQALKDALAAQTPRAKRGRKPPKFYYATQIATNPPTIVAFVNATGLVSRNYQRFLLNRFRESLPFGEIPIRLVCRPRRDRRSTK
ncbi:MAG: ribosome biogenesis GTPase Der [Phycisphaerales bacterium]|nr:MAG: ribosome biogenesis GTPase Der [Phycisphaerales bacterium]